MKKFFLTVALITGNVYLTFAQGAGGAAGIQAASSEIKSYMEPVTTLCYVIAGIVAIIGALKLYSKWNQGEEVSKDLMGWGGALVFLLVVPTVVTGFFG